MQNPKPKLSIPYLFMPDKPITSTSQNHLPIADITNDIVIYKDGGAAVVLESTSLNFGLLSEKEQAAVIAAYAAMINSLSFTCQILVRTQRKDISSYITYLDEQALKLKHPLLIKLMAEYKGFILESVKKKNVLGKRFYVILYLSPLELGLGKSIQSVTRRGGPLPFTKSFVVKKAKIILYPRRDHMVRQAGRLGIKFRQYNTKELIELYYSVYNPIRPAVKKEPEVVLERK